MPSHCRCSPQFNHTQKSGIAAIVCKQRSDANPASERSMRRPCRNLPTSTRNRISAIKVLEHMRLGTDPKKLAMLRSRAKQEKRVQAERNRLAMYHPHASEPN